MNLELKPKPKRIYKCAKGKTFWLCTCGSLVPENDMSIYLGQYLCLTCVEKKKESSK